MPVIKPAGEHAPEVQLPRVIKLQQEVLNHVQEIKNADVSTLTKLLESEREENTKREANLLGQVQDLQLWNKRLEEELAVVTVPNKDTTVSQKDIRIPALLMLFLLVLATIAGGASTALLLN